jgi:hypothetical protein
MNHATGTTASDNGGTFDPRQAAAVLDQTTRQARRQLQPSPPWLLATRAVLVLLALGAIWLSVRGQHPYRGPTAVGIPVLIGFIVVNFTATVAARHRAIAGVVGKTRFTQAEIAIMAASWLAAVVLLLALAGAGVSAGHYPTTVLIIPGLAYAGVMVARAGWRGCAMGLAVAAIGVAGLFAGSAGSWAVAGAGLCIALLAQAAVIAWQQRA